MRPASSRLALAALAFAAMGCANAFANPQPAATKAITAPSGSHPQARAAQCKAEVNKKNLERNARQAFYKACLASAAPVAATGSKDNAATPTPAKPKLEGLTDAKPH